MSRFYEFQKKYARVILASTIAGLIFFAWWIRFIQDDAFISFRYADNLVRGLGLVWNEGEKVEGYSNFLWTMLMSIVLYFGWDPVAWSAVFGLTGFACSLYLTYRISLHIFQSDYISLLAVILLGSNYTFSAYATGGLETSVQAMLYLSVIYCVVRALRVRSCRITDVLTISIILSACMLLRLDSAMLCIVVFTFTSFIVLRQAESSRSKMLCMIALISPFLIIIGAWFTWKLWYYGDILPNTFYLKVSSVHSLTRGLVYLHRYLASYLFYPIVLVSILSLKSFFRELRGDLLLIFLIALTWIAYVVKVGGDFMEFRFLVPILPILVLLFVWLLFEVITSKIIRTGLILLVLLGSLHHVLTFTYDANDGIEPIPRLGGHILNANEHWGEIGKVLGRAFDYDPRVSIATTAAGAIPYYSQLTTIDMLGLNDRYIARFGYYFGRAAGHERIATLSYLQERKVNLIISHPFVTGLSDPMVKVPLLPGVAPNKWPESKALEIPLDSLYKIIILYLTPSSLVDSIIVAKNWKVHQIVKG